ncbi:MAG: hypothetical protein GVY23_02770 [Spirochaetes bacterium]|jgi:hypothetical protein|nr:hypothetical protein [Spirochaetota bacterium]
MMLSALRLPGNIEGRLADLQAGLFRARGLLSARAFPPLVPLLWTQRPPELAAVDPAPLPPLTIGGLETGTAGILLGLLPRRPLEDLARHLEKASREEVREVQDAKEHRGTPPFPVGTPGILLAPPGHGVADHVPEAHDRAPDAAAGAPLDTGEVSGTIIRRFTLVVIEIRAWQGDGPERVVWEEVARRLLRKQRG